MSGISVTVDLSSLYDEMYGDTENNIKEIIKDDIKRQLKRSPEYKAYIKKSTDSAIAGIV